MVIAKGADGQEFEPVPQGLHQAVCIDVIDKGIVQTQWGAKHRVQIRWALDALNERGREHWVMASYNLTLGTPSKPSALRTALESWRGKPFTAEEEAGFDLDKVIGANCQIQVIHKMGDGGKMWANVQAIVPLGKNAPLMRIPADYVRVSKRDAQQQPQRAAQGQSTLDPIVDADTVPF